MKARDNCKPPSFYNLKHRGRSLSEPSVGDLRRNGTGERRVATRSLQRKTGSISESWQAMRVPLSHHESLVR